MESLVLSLPFCYPPLNSAHIGDASMAHILACKELTSLDLGLTEVSDGGVARLLKCPKLRELNLDETKVTDAVLATLGKFRTLEVVNVTRTKVSKEALRKFIKAHPRLKVYSDWEDRWDD